MGRLGEELRERELMLSFSFLNFRCSRQRAYCSRFARWRSSSSFGRNRNLSRDPRSVITIPQLCLLKQWQVFSGEWQRKTLPWQHRNYLCRLSLAVSSSLIWSRRLFLGGFVLGVVLLLHLAEFAPALVLLSLGGVWIFFALKPEHKPVDV